MRRNRVKQVMSEGKLAIGTYVALSDPQIVEIIGLAGFDAAFIDMEHTNFEMTLVGEMIRAADLAGVASIIRVPGNDANIILRLLDMGAEGIIIPHIEGIAGAKRAVDAVRYPPLGAAGRRRRQQGRPLRRRVLGRPYSTIKRRDPAFGDGGGRKGDQ